MCLMCSVQTASSNVTCSVRSGETSGFTPGVAMRADVLFSSLYHQAYHDLFQEITSLTGVNAPIQAGPLPCIHKAIPVCVHACFRVNQAVHPEPPACTLHGVICMYLQGPSAILHITNFIEVIVLFFGHCPLQSNMLAHIPLLCEYRLTVMLGSSLCFLRSWWRG